MALRHGKAFSRDLVVLLIGTENTGKTSLISTFVGEKFVENQKATDGAETKVCKVYATDWKKITKEEKTVHLYGKFIHSIQESAKGIKFKPLHSMPFMPKPESSSPASRPVTSLSDEELPKLKDEDLEEISSGTSQYEHDSINVVAWDYAGQVIFHNTHSVFMSENGIPIITFNASMDLTDEIRPREGAPIPPECRTNISSLHYWLHTVSSICPAVDGPMALLVGTHIDLLHDDIREARKIAEKKFLPQLKNELYKKPYQKKLIGNEKGIKQFLEKYCFFVSNKVRDEEIDRLKSTVVEIAPLKEEPVVYLKIEQSLLGHEKQIITRTDLHKIAVKCGFPVSENSPQFEGLISYLHNKRVILNFDIPSLRNLVILSPHWLAKLFSYVITAHTYDEGGDLDRDEAWERLNKYGILGGNLFGYMVQKFCVDYPSVVNITKQQVLDILLRFHLVARVTAETWFQEEEDDLDPPDNFGDTFIVPSFVHQDDGKCPPDTDKERIICFIFRSGFVPTNILNQLIVECINRNQKMKHPLLW